MTMTCLNDILDEIQEDMKCDRDASIRILNELYDEAYERCMTWFKETYPQYEIADICNFEPYWDLTSMSYFNEE